MTLDGKGFGPRGRLISNASLEPLDHGASPHSDQARHVGTAGWWPSNRTVLIAALFALTAIVAIGGALTIFNR
jgi:hypothetical protein